MVSPLGLREIGFAAGLLAVVAAIVSLVFPGAWPYATGAAVVVFVAVALFFRDPERDPPEAPRVLVAPADGQIVEIAETDDVPGLPGSCHKVAIFMSLLNVHVNRSPCDGRVVEVTRRPGEFVGAMRAEASARNEANLIALHNTEVDQPILLAQIAGLVARRVVCTAQPGDGVKRGQRIGMVKFGSRAEVFVGREPGFRWRVRLGEKVRAGETILGEWT